MEIGEKLASKIMVFLSVFLFVFSLAIFFFSLADSGSNRVSSWSGKSIFNQSSGLVNLTIAESLNINFTIDSISWGSGKVTYGEDNASLDTASGSVSRGTWIPVTRGFILENLGNVNATIYMKTAKSASEFLGGTNPVYQYNVTNNKTGSCVPASSFNLSEWRNVNATTNESYEGDKVCDSLAYKDDKDQIKVDIKLGIPSDSNLGSLSDILTATAYKAGSAPW